MRRLGICLTVLAASLVLAACSGTGVAEPGHATPAPRPQLGLENLATARATLASTGLHLPQDCIPQNGVQIQVGVIANFAAHLTVGSELESDISGNLCGIGELIAPPPGYCPPGTVAALSFVVPADGQMFASPIVKITLVPGVTPSLPNVHVNTQKITAMVCAGQGTGAIHINLTITISASDSFFGTNCAIGPLTVPLIGVIYGSLGDFTANLSAEFSIPAATPSRLCPGGLTKNINEIFQFPTAPMAAHLSLTAHGEAYCDLPNALVCSLPTGGV